LKLLGHVLRNSKATTAETGLIFVISLAPRVIGVRFLRSALTVEDKRLMARLLTYRHFSFLAIWLAYLKFYYIFPAVGCYPELMCTGWEFMDKLHAHLVVKGSFANRGSVETPLDAVGATGTSGAKARCEIS
jgi:hypothetical protein